MTYLRALGLLVKAYKAAKGVMPKGLDLLKMKMKARQKVIDANKVIQAADRFDKGNWFRLNKRPAREGFGKPKKVETEAEMLARMKRQNKEAAQRLRDKKEKDLGDRLKDLPDDIPDMANGGIANLTSVYNQNPSLQSQYTLDEYLDLFDTQTVTPQIQTSADILEQAKPDPINPIKPIIPLPESGDGGGGNPPPGGGISRGINLDYGYTSPGGTFNLDDIGEGTVADEDYTLGMRARDAVSGIMSSPFVKYNPMNPMFMFNVGKAGVEKAKEFAEQVRAQKALEEEQARQAQLNAARAALAYQTQTGEGSGYTGGFDPSTQNYDDPFDPGQTE